MTPSGCERCSYTLIYRKGVPWGTFCAGCRNGTGWNTLRGAGLNAQISLKSGESRLRRASRRPQRWPDRPSWHKSTVMDLGELPIALGHSLNALAGRATHWRALQPRPVPRGTRALSLDIKIDFTRARRRFRVFEFFICFVFVLFFIPCGPS